MNSDYPYFRPLVTPEVYTPELVRLYKFTFWGTIAAGLSVFMLLLGLFGHNNSTVMLDGVEQVFVYAPLCGLISLILMTAVLKSPFKPKRKAEKKILAQLKGASIIALTLLIISSLVVFFIAPLILT